VGIRKACRQIAKRILQTLFADQNIRLDRMETFLESLGRGQSALALGQSAIPPHLEALRRDVARLGRELEFVKRHRGTYLGEGTSMVWLVDETVVYVHSTDEGVPPVLISGGTYEEANLTVLFSFLKHDSLVLDVGANLGVFSLRIADRLRGTNGRVIAFEPHPEAYRLLKMSIERNGLESRIEGHNVALADRNDQIKLYYPNKNIGGGGAFYDVEGAIPIEAELKVLDEILPDQTVDLVKMDVENNEYLVFLGMRKIIKRSTRIAILFEKLTIKYRDDPSVYQFLTQFGLTIYAVTGDALLKPVDLEGYQEFGGYFLATRAETLCGYLDRRFFEVGWQSLTLHKGTAAKREGNSCELIGAEGDCLFYGPYWYLPRGRYLLTVIGKKEGSALVNICERYGSIVKELAISEGHMSAEFEVADDLYKFECVFNAGKGGLRLQLEAIQLRRQ